MPSVESVTFPPEEVAFETVIDWLPVCAMLIEPVALTVLEIGPVHELDPAKRFPWRVFNIPLEGCGWLEQDAVPTAFGRRYKQILHRVQAQYSRMAGTDKADMDLAYEDGQFAWVKASDGFEYNMGRKRGGKGFIECELVATSFSERSVTAKDRSSSRKASTARKACTTAAGRA